MPVAAIENGVVIDHIPPEKLFHVAALLHLETCSSPIMIGNNFKSRHMGKKGIIKIAGLTMNEVLLNRIALVAPNVKISTIRDFEVVEKKEVHLPDQIIGLVACNNPKCITNNEPMLTRFLHHEEEGEDILECAYCSRKIKRDQLTLL